MKRRRIYVEDRLRGVRVKRARGLFRSASSATVTSAHTSARRPSGGLKRWSENSSWLPLGTAPSPCFASVPLGGAALHARLRPLPLDRGFEKAVAEARAARASASRSSRAATGQASSSGRTPPPTTGSSPCSSGCATGARASCIPRMGGGVRDSRSACPTRTKAAIPSATHGFEFRRDGSVRQPKAWSRQQGESGLARRPKRTSAVGTALAELCEERR